MIDLTPTERKVPRPRMHGNARAALVFASLAIAAADEACELLTKEAIAAARVAASNARGAAMHARLTDCEAENLAALHAAEYASDAARYAETILEMRQGAQ